MKIAYIHLVQHINENPSIEDISNKLFQLGHEHEIDGDIFDVTLFNANELRLVQNDTYTEDGVDFVVTGELRMIR